MLLKIALRNIDRNRRRTIFSALTIAVGMLFFSVMDSLLAGMDKGAVTAMIELSVGAVKIQTRAYDADKESFPLDHGIDTRNRLTAELKKDLRVTAVTGRTLFLGRLSNNTDMIAVTGIVIEPQTDAQVFSLTRYLEGNYFSNDSRREIILGKDLAKEMRVAPGDQITLYAVTRYDSRNAEDFTIIGLVNCTDPGINKNTVILSRDAGEPFLQLDGLVTELNVALKGRNLSSTLFHDMTDIQQRLGAQFPAYTFLTYNEMGADFRALAQGKKKFSFMFLWAILFIAAVGIFNTVLMSVYERIREIGVLRAHGIEPASLAIMFMMEGMFTGLLGALIGGILSVGLVGMLVTIGIPMDRFMSGMDTTGFPVWGTLHGVWNFPALFFSGVVAVLISSVAAILPARKAAKMSITETLRFN
jgi:putative ABC transport system permease protein